MNKTLNNLSDHLPQIENCIRIGFKKAIDYAKMSPFPLNKSTISNIANNSIKNEVKHTFPEHMWKKNGMRLDGLIIDGIIVRFKKLNSKLLPGNVDTEQARRFAGQMPLPGLPVIKNINAGWVLDKTGTKIDTIYLTQQKSLSENSWVANIVGYLNNGYKLPEPDLVEWANSVEVKSLVKPKQGVRKKSVKQKIASQNE